MWLTNYLKRLNESLTYKLGSDLIKYCDKYDKMLVKNGYLDSQFRIYWQDQINKISIRQ